MLKTSSFVIVSLLFCASVSADIVGVTSVAFTGTAVEHFADENNLINGNGLSAAVNTEADFATVTHGNAGATTAWATNNPNGGNGNDYYDPAGTGGTVVFDFTLDALYTDIDEMVNWGYHFNNNPTGNFASAGTLEFSTDGGTTFYSSENVTIGLVTSASTSTTFAARDADFIRLTVTDNHFGVAPAGGDRVGLAEVRFANTVAVPEPTSSALLLGLAGFGFVARRRNRV